ncbi:NAD(P)H:quinone oxidoreductase [Sporichthya brevicatena]|uniref:NAD(P)H:quinone oxidoreductase n=1 Tax=Sporichthya brevicatena TaxID=171442 RepID=A0ABN1GFH6_9ACTN
MTLAVTAATGGLGRETLDALLRRVPASELVAIARRPEALADLAALGVEIRGASYDDPDALRAALTGVDRLLLISGSEVGRRVVQHGNVIDAAKAADVPFVAYTSITRADTTSLLLAAEHRATEEALAQSGLTYALLRNGWYHENYLAHLPTYLANGVAGAAGDGLISGAARADYAEAAAAVLTGTGHDGAVYELGGSAYTLTDLAATISAVTGREVRYTNLTEEAYRDLLIGLGLPEPMAAVVADADRGIAAGELHVPGSDLAALIGREPVSLRAAVEAAVATAAAAA